MSQVKHKHTGAILHLYSANAVSLATVMNDCEKFYETGLLYCFDHASLLLVTGKETVEICPVNAERVVVDLSQLVQSTSIKAAYEARLFNANQEIRWLKDPNTANRGKAVLLSEHEVELKNKSIQWQKEPTIEALYTQPSQYLMMGKTYQEIDEANAWVGMSSARIGRYFVPVEACSEDSHAYLLATEYFGLTNDQYGKAGNVSFVAERLMKWGKLSKLSLTNQRKQ